MTSPFNETHSLPQPEPQRPLVIGVCGQTGLNIKYSLDCLNGNGWDLGRAVANFNQVKVGGFQNLSGTRIDKVAFCRQRCPLTPSCDSRGSGHECDCLSDAPINHNHNNIITPPPSCIMNDSRRIRACVCVCHNVQYRLYIAYHSSAIETYFYGAGTYLLVPHTCTLV